MKLYNCIIVDDEPLARDILVGYLSIIPSLTLIASCKNSSEAIVVLQQNKIDLIFCDIKMPGLNGLQFLKSLYQPPKIIITTAYRDYAIEGFDIGVVDYLLKPIPIERFVLAVNRALDIERAEKKAEENIQMEFMFFKTGTSIERIYLVNINYVTAYGNYCKIYLADNSKYITVNHKISELESMLSQKGFIRVHKSYLINEKKITKISSNCAYISMIEIPIGDNYKNNLLEKLNNLGVSKNK